MSNNFWTGDSFTTDLEAQRQLNQLQSVSPDKRFHLVAVRQRRQRDFGTVAGRISKLVPIPSEIRDSTAISAFLMNYIRHLPNGDPLVKSLIPLAAELEAIER